MLISIDGACKRNGKPDCISVGVAWIHDEQGNMLFKSAVEQQSTSQRGEINGLLEALKYAKQHSHIGEDIIIVTDSEYLYNTVMLEWCFKWRNNGWISASGTTPKNDDMWEQVCQLLDAIGTDRVFLQWTKGHIVHYTPSHIRQAMVADISGVELYSRILAMASRVCDKPRIIKDFLKERQEHDKMSVPEEIAFEWAVANATADALASYIVTAFDAALPR